MPKRLNRITVHPEISMGQPTIRGMRIPVAFVLKLIASGMTHAEIQKPIRSLKRQIFSRLWNTTPQDNGKLHWQTGGESQMPSVKIVGRRSGKIDPSPEASNAWLQTIGQLRANKGICPRGVYKFKTFEESNQWMYRMIARSSLKKELEEGAKEVTDA